MSRLFQKRPAVFKFLTRSLGIENDVGLSRVGKREVAGTVVPDPSQGTRC